LGAQPLDLFDQSVRPDIDSLTFMTIRRVEVLEIALALSRSAALALHSSAYLSSWPFAMTSVVNDDSRLALSACCLSLTT